jgi:hypothetical protein
VRVVRILLLFLRPLNILHGRLLWIFQNNILDLESFALLIPKSILVFLIHWRRSCDYEQLILCLRHNSHIIQVNAFLFSLDFIGITIRVGTEVKV